MGINDRELEAKLNKRQKARESRARRASALASADWNSFDWVRAVALVRALAEEQGALRLGLTRDGGAFALGIYLGGDYATEYIRPSEDVPGALDEIARAWLGEGISRYEHFVEEMSSRVP